MRLISLILCGISIFSCGIICKKTAEINQGLKPKTILRQGKKMNLFYEDVKNETNSYVTNAIVTDDIMINSYYNVGLYNWRRNSDHLSHGYQRYFFNYVDTVYFVQKYDTLNWNKRVNDFLKEYDQKLSEGEKLEFQNQIID